MRPQRTAGNTRLYSDARRRAAAADPAADDELGLNLAGVERVLAMEDELQRMRRRLERMEQEMRSALDEVHRQYRRDLVALPADATPGPEGQ